MAQVLRHVPQVDDPRVLIDAATRDDAAVFRLSDDRALAASVDFFAPIVDDPYAFGAIAAANAFSDLYAMGATPLFALNLVAWPRNPELLELLGETLRGGVDVAREAGALVLGGHSIDDPEPKYGMVTIGDVHPAAVITNASAQPGDHLVLTKPVGTGILSTALKRDLLAESDVQPAVRSMSTLNAGAARAMREVGDGVHAATDVTGFGLLGHLQTLLEASGCGARVSVSDLPVFKHVRRLIEEDAIPGGTKRNLVAANDVTAWSPEVSETDRVLVADAQTSGGLLVAIDPGRSQEFLRHLKRERTPAASIIGQVIEAGEQLIEVTA